MTKNNLYDLEIIAGPCSITPENTEEVINEIAKIETPDGKRAIFGTRVVGLKSRTALDLNGEGMGIDSQAIQQAMKLSSNERMEITIPSIELAKKIVKQTGMVITTEIMIPHIQLPYWESKTIFNGKLMIWNPAVNQLGWNLYEMSGAQKNNWNIGLKHGKFLGKDPLEVANHPEYKGETSMEKVLIGLTSYVPEMREDLIIIHRGVDVPGRGDYRNAITHEIMKRIKKKIPKSNRLYFDPTHSIGPVMRHKIIDEIMRSMEMKIDDEFLYDGILMEAGSSSPVDLGEHVTIEELKQLVTDLSKFRKLRTPETT